MSLTTIQLGGQTVTLVVRPPIALREVQWEMNDSVALVTSPFTKQTQAQQWPGADWLSGTMSFPPLSQTAADQVISFLMQCRGMAVPFQLGDPLKKRPLGHTTGVPLVDGTVAASNAAGTTQLQTRGWLPNSHRVLVPGDWLQIGYRLHRNLDIANADANGNASLNIFPSLREQPADATPLVLHDTQGLFRLASNKRTWSADVTRLSSVSFPIMEYR